MFKRKLIAAAVALAFAAPALAQDAELAKIREEIRQMKEKYEQRIEASEKRLAERKRKPARRKPARPRRKPRRPPRRSARTAKTRSIPRCRSCCKALTRIRRRIPIRTTLPGSCPRAAKSGRPSAVSASARPNSRSPPISTLISAASRLLRLRPRAARRRGSVFSDARIAAGIHAQGRALFLGHRLPERAAPARMGFPGRAACLQGVSRRPVEAGRRAAQMDRADRPAGRAGRRSFRRQPVSGQRPQQERHGTAVACSRTSRGRYRIEATPGAPGFPICETSPTAAANSRRRCARYPVANRFSGAADLWVADADPEVGAARRFDVHQFQTPGRVLPSHPGRHAHLRRHRGSNASAGR